MMAEFYGHNPRAVGYVLTSWKTINFMWKWRLTNIRFNHWKKYIMGLDTNQKIKR